MGSPRRFKSAHMADIKGKGIMYEDDDEPIQLVAKEDSHAQEFRLTLIGKVLNQKKQNVEKLTKYMLNQWGMQDRVTANDLGNGKFLFNFTTEEDLEEVLRQGPFHYNYYMFVLVKWEPIVDDDYPWIIPFWVRITGLPLHLWDADNLDRIGSRLGHIDTIEQEEGRMLVQIDSRKALKFKRKVTTGGKEVTIQIAYDLLFKHCSICGMLSHEKDHCPAVKEELQEPKPAERTGVFARVQMPQGQVASQPSLSNQSHRDMKHNRQPLLMEKRSYVRQNHQTEAARTWGYEDDYSNRYRVANNNRQKSHYDRIIRVRDERPSYRYGGARNSRPYERKAELTWREKAKGYKETSTSGVDKRDEGSGSRDDAPYGHISKEKGSTNREEDNQRSGDDDVSRGELRGKRLASAIVTPTRHLPMEDNVTIRSSLGQTLTFSPQHSANATENDQVIEALNDMELLDTYEGQKMECDDYNDDLLADELMDMEKQIVPLVVDEVSKKKLHNKDSKRPKSGTRPNAPLGIRYKKKLHNKDSKRPKSGTRPNAP